MIISGCVVQRRKTVVVFSLRARSVAQQKVYKFQLPLGGGHHQSRQPFLVIGVIDVAVSVVQIVFEACIVIFVDQLDQGSETQHNLALRILRKERITKHIERS